jgi:hypothetical protein
LERAIKAWWLDHHHIFYQSTVPENHIRSDEQKEGVIDMERSMTNYPRQNPRNSFLLFLIILLLLFPHVSPPKPELHWNILGGRIIKISVKN